MKHLNSITFFLMLALLLPATATAHDFEVDGIYYNITSNNTVEVCGASNISDFYDYYYGHIYEASKVDIPREVTYNDNYYLVTAIGDSAFYGKAFYQMTIPETVTSIGVAAFKNLRCFTQLTYLSSTIPSMNDSFDKHHNSYSLIFDDGDEYYSFFGLYLIVPSSTYQEFVNINEDQELFSHVFCLDWEKTTPTTTISHTTSLGRIVGAHISINTNEDSYIWVHEIIKHMDSMVSGASYETYDQEHTWGIVVGSWTCSPYYWDIDAIAITDGKLPSDWIIRGWDWESEDLSEWGDYLFSPYMTTVWPLDFVSDSICYYYSDYEGDRGEYIYDNNDIFIGCHEVYVSSGYYINPCFPDEHPRIMNHSKDIVIPSTVNGCTVKGLGYEAFKDYNLRSLYLPNTIDYISSPALPAHIQKLIVPISLRYWNAYESDVDSLYFIGDGQWQGIPLPIELKALYVGSGVTGLRGMEVNPEVIYCYATTPPICNNDTSFYEDDFGDYYEWSGSFTGYDAELHVPATSINAYQTAPIWCNFTNIIGDAVPLEDITINQDSIEVVIGRQTTLATTLSPTNAMPNAVSWNSSDESIATIENGVITAIKKGECDVFAFCQDKHAVCHVKVSEILPTAVTLNQESAIIETDSQLTLTATVLPEDATYKNVSWWSSNKAVATVSDNGVVTAVGTGECEITAWCRGVKAICHVLVTEALSNYDNYLSVNDAETYLGKTIVIPVKMTNNQSISSFQTDVYLPDGLELMKEDGEYLIEPSDRMTRTHSIMCDDLANDAIRVLCYSSNYKPFTGASGDDLFYLTVKAADNASGDYFIQLKNTLLTTSDFTELTAPDVAAIVRVNDYMPGDANGNGTITVTDAVITAFYVLERNPEPFFFNAADVNKDGNITVTDVTRIAWMVLNPTLTAPRRAPALWNNSDRLSSEAITLAAGETRRVSILLDNEMDYNGFQLDLRLPAGLTASNFSLTDRANSHTFDVNTLQSGDIRALCYSPAMTAINGHEGALLSFDVTATGSVKGDITVDGIELVTTDCQTVKLDAFTIGVNTTTAVNELAPSKAIARIEYFDLAGQKIDRPTIGVTLVVTTYTDGTRSTAKLLQ